ncbi:MAG: hypothetical protein K2L13_02960 [Opitutales bacterium]|nr:hypothetical protein [Opitutales bacterium]
MTFGSSEDISLNKLVEGGNLLSSVQNNDAEVEAKNTSVRSSLDYSVSPANSSNQLQRSQGQSESSSKDLQGRRAGDVVASSGLFSGNWLASLMLCMREVAGLRSILGAEFVRIANEDEGMFSRFISEFREFANKIFSSQYASSDLVEEMYSFFVCFCEENMPREKAKEACRLFSIVFARADARAVIGFVNSVLMATMPSGS